MLKKVLVTALVTTSFAGALLPAVSASAKVTKNNTVAVMKSAKATTPETSKIKFIANRIDKTMFDEKFITEARVTINANQKIMVSYLEANGREIGTFPATLSTVADKTNANHMTVYSTGLVAKVVYKIVDQKGTVLEEQGLKVENNQLVPDDSTTPEVPAPETVSPVIPLIESPEIVDPEVPTPESSKIKFVANRLDKTMFDEKFITEARVSINADQKIMVSYLEANGREIGSFPATLSTVADKTNANHTMTYDRDLVAKVVYKIVDQKGTVLEERGLDYADFN